MKYPARVFACAVMAHVCLCATGAFAQDKPSPDHTGDAQPAQDHPTKAPKPKSRLNLLRQMQIDLDMAASRAQVDEKDRKKLDKCHEVLIDAIAQQQRYKSVNSGKVNGCLKDLDKLLEDRKSTRLNSSHLGIS